MSTWLMLTVLFGFAPMAYTWQPFTAERATGERDRAEDP
jgi:hypothetical protein